MGNDFPAKLWNNLLSSSIKLGTGGFYNSVRYFEVNLIPFICDKAISTKERNYWQNVMTTHSKGWPLGFGLLDKIFIKKKSKGSGHLWQLLRPVFSPGLSMHKITIMWICFLNFASIGHRYKRIMKENALKRVKAWSLFIFEW